MKSTIQFDKRHPVWRMTAAAGAVVGFLAIGYLAAERGADPNIPVKRQTAAVEPEVVVASVIERKVTTAPATTTPVATSISSETRTAQIDRLARGTPEDALVAANMLHACASFDPATLMAAQEQDPTVKEELQKFVPVRACDGITGGQLSMLVPLTIRAAKAHVPGAFALLLTQINGSKTDPRIDSAWEEVLAINLKAAEPSALIARFAFESNCGDPPKCTNVDLRSALVHWTTYLDTGGGASRPDTVTPRLRKVLGPDAAAAIAEGHAAFANRGAK